jgi:alkylation response protein AidB-like acyl-CoA dehydrogenase
MLGYAAAVSDWAGEQLRHAVRAFLAESVTAGGRATWKRFAGELDVAGLAIPEEYGGAGCGFGEVAIVCEEIGRALSALPYLQTVVAAEAVRSAGEGGDLLCAIAAGERTATVVLPGDAEVELRGDRLTGVVPYALEGELVLVHTGGLLVEAAPTRRTPYATLDGTRPLAELAFEAVPVRRLGTADGARTRDLAVALLAAEQAGGAARCLESSVAYAKERHQFGRPIGAFQAVKHKLADVLVRVESARSAAYAAAEHAGDPVCAALAGSYCTEAYLHAAGENIQIHGGIGVTWEHDAHLYFKRATSDAQLFGPPERHRARLGEMVF